MKPKLWKILTVCVLTLVVLSPALVVMIWVWQKHLQFVETQHLVYGFGNAKKLINHRADTTIYVLLWLMFFAPFSLGLGIAVHHRYLVYRAGVRQKQIKTLEKMWHKSIYVQDTIKIDNQ